MEILINLLERKNLCFRSFHKLCDDFIDEIAKSDTTNLEMFQKRRQGLIKVLEQLEFEVTQWLDAYKNPPGALDAIMTDQAKQRVDQLLREKDGIVRSILDIDLRILAHIDRIKDETIQKLQSLQSGKKALAGYRSPLETVETAENDKILDREA